MYYILNIIAEKDQDLNLIILPNQIYNQFYHLHNQLINILNVFRRLFQNNVS